ncbi:uncharacterized protein FIBRA_04547 [Fibroporia radiculosa]|uniref:Uncharacterized protein n=1 Tax=Fibroporia radiculosa TaxID=599839 RepID=J4G7J9_9APHY|nr:uncharacterized protein FIBRA_04547 [Fibroporia radiculosa]CCM02448.1 predicted protein [Fibroporia radiculosa]
MEPLPLVFVRLPRPTLCIDSPDALLNRSRSHGLGAEKPTSEDELSRLQSAFTAENIATSGSLALTAVLPVTQSSVSDLKSRLGDILGYSQYLSDIIVLSPVAVIPRVRRVLLSALASGGHSAHIELTVRPWSTDEEQDSATLRIASQATSPFVLILCENGLDAIDVRSREALMLLEPFSTMLPIGPRGFVLRDSKHICLSSSRTPQLATFLVPPFVIPATFISSFGFNLSREGAYGIWLDLGKCIARTRADSAGGFVVGSGEGLGSWCSNMTEDTALSSQKLPIISNPLLDQKPIELFANKTRNAGVDSTLASGTFLLVFTSLLDLTRFSGVACRWRQDGHKIHAALFVRTDHLKMAVLTGVRQLILEDCNLDYHFLPTQSSGFELASEILTWFNCQPITPDIVVTTISKLVLLDEVFQPKTASQNKRFTVIHLPADDLPYCDWIGSLTPRELENWHKPHIDISVITNDRPHSLARLLTSLSSALYFGDSPDLRVNLEQTADRETSQIVESFKWDKGQVFLHRRVVHGGLLPAVVESWYPHSTDSYGLILEDDVELSPLFYAWAKLALLHYRYGRSEDRSSRMFGISLYQQKNLELRPEGRHPFNARDVFTAAGIDDPSTPYLSQIPCSWGAVYFPEHWREFHAYLSLRLSEYAWDADQVVAPGVRSNKWMRSWKKYFIELAYLRGYVMLYPNFDGYVSLSTNHLEVGSHVKDVPKEVYLRKKRLFLLPLMALPDLLHSNATGLLDLPDHGLPPWDQLPVLDLLGLPASEETLVERGSMRRIELTGCEDTIDTVHDVWDLLCLHDPLFDL